MTVDRIIWNKLKVSRTEPQPKVGDRKANRINLAEIFAEAGYKHGAEIGVFRGDYSQILFKAIPRLKLLCVDPWEAYMGKSPRRMDKIYRTTRNTLAPYNVEIVRMRSVDAVKLVPDSSLDFVYIDGLHEFDPAMMDIILWEPKVRVGGIVSGHDYSNRAGWGVVEATNAYVSAHQIPNWYLIIGNDTERSWLWVKRR